MTTDPMPLRLPSAASRTLRFWHQVEFFIPFDLQRQVLEADDAPWSVRMLSLRELQTSSTPLWHVNPPEGLRLTGFDIYLGLFDKKQLGDVAGRVVRETLTPEEQLEEDERGQLEGYTCVARIKAGTAGEPLLEEISVSTAPWALGRILAHGGLSGLDFDAFLAGVDGLKDDLRQFRADRLAANRGQPRPAAAALGPEPLSAAELQALLAMLTEWAGYPQIVSDSQVPVLLIRAKTVVDRPKKAAGDAAAANAPDTADDDEDEDAAAADDDVEVDILNSFYAGDIARAIASVERKESCLALDAYLAPSPPQERIDLYSDAGRDHIMQTVAPARMPAAHWPDEPEHAMSLMQQFAINSMLEKLETGGIFSVNGPPGTGKTTLLRDVFAELITKRARVLSTLARSADAFREVTTVSFDKESPCRISRLREDLTGFEMLVASSNNAAVENLSRDLPKSKSLGKRAWRDAQGEARIGYLQPVAHNIAARTAKGDYAPLASDDTPWGLVACALGKKRNRTDFAYRLGVDGKRDRPAGFNPAWHQSLWTWREKPDCPSFAAAKAAFQKAETAVAQRRDALARYAALSLQLAGRTLADFRAALSARLAQAAQEMEAARVASAAIGTERALCNDQLVILREEERLIGLGRPGWLTRWLRPARERDHQARLADNRQQQQAWLARLRQAAAREPGIAQEARLAATAHAQTQRDLAAKEQEWTLLQQEWTALRSDFPDAACPGVPSELENEEWQIDGIWRDASLNRMRSELFVAALGLHEAWLAEVLQKGGGFGSNVVAIGHLLAGKRLQDNEHALAIWQSLFMVVPVVSSTFASIATQFRHLGPNSLGWLFIDEAGQAVPQAAVGALWRARRAVVVGDPLQIEPVFTVPIRLIEALARAGDLPAEPPVGPDRASVQNLADLANPKGAWTAVSESPQWIGSPLRVHRRCVDPMFTIANEIAYGGKMIFFDPKDASRRAPPADSLDIGPSAWVNLGGTASNRQVVPEQVDLIFRAVVALHQRTGALPELYIISPFRRVKEALARKLAEPGNWPAANRPRTPALREWCKTRIGTVHTFQGKEESLVWMVLGCDAATRSAATWAAGKPNLLNVALTRAKHRFFMVGDEALWAGLPHFATASAALLPRISPASFLERIAQPDLALTDTTT